jgi:hypothetical protein
MYLWGNLKRSLIAPSHGRNEKIKIDTKIGFNGISWIDLLQDRRQLQCLMSIQWTSGFQKRMGHFWQVEWLPVSQGSSKFRPIKKTPWPESASELYRPSDRRLSAKWLPTLADKGCHVVKVTDPYGRILSFLDTSCYFSIKYLLSCTHEAEWTPFQTHYFFFGSAGNRTRAFGSVAKNSAH